MDRTSKEIIIIYLKSKKVIFTFFLLLIVFSINAISLKNNDFNNDLILIQFFQMNFNKLIVLFIIVPCFFFLLNEALSMFDQHKILIRYTFIKKWWLQKTITLCFITFLFVLIVNVLFIISLIGTGVIAYFSISFFIYWFLGFFLQYIGFILISSIYLTLVYLFNNNFLSIIVTYLFLIFPFSITGLFFVKVYTFPEFMYLSNVFDYDSTIPNFLIGFPISALISCSILMCNYYIIKRQDIFWSK